jgi:hypothetical protein
MRNLLFISFAAFTVFSSTLAFSQEVDQYPETIDLFAQSFDHAVRNDFMPKLANVPNSERATFELTKSLELLEQQIAVYKELYIRVMIQDDAETEKNLSRDLYSSEHRLKVYFTRLATILAEFNPERKLVVGLTSRLIDYNKSVEASEEMSFSPRELKRTILPFRSKSLQTIYRYVYGNLTNQNLFGLADSIPTGALLPPGKNPQPVFETHFNDGSIKQGFEIEVPTGDEVTIVTANHDHALFDMKLTMDILRKKFNAANDEFLVVTTKAAFPKYKMYKTEENVFLIENPMFAKNILKKIAALEGRRAFVIIAPEGAQTQWNIQFPTLAKPGAFSIAATLAKLIKNKKVSYLEMQNNLAAFVADSSEANLHVDVYEAEQVDPKDSTWAERMQLRFQNHLTKFRTQIVDLENPKIIPKSRIFEVKTRSALPNQCELNFSPAH